MKNTPFAFPGWINEFIPDDELFASAYDDISDQNRAWMKTCIARLYDWYGPRKDYRGEVTRYWQAGFNTRTTYEAVDFSIVLFDDSLLSPSRLLAALVPALAGGVQNVLAVRVADEVPWRKAVLTGLELAGQEFVVNMTDTQARRLFSELRDVPHVGAVTVLGPKAALIKTNELQAASRMSFWRPRFSRAASIWMDKDDTFDLETLAFIHPDVLFNVYGTKTSLPTENFSYVGNQFDAFIENIADVAYLPEQRMDHEALAKARLILGPGQEGCWIWPDLHPEQFQYHCTAWTIGG